MEEIGKNQDSRRTLVHATIEDFGKKSTFSGHLAGFYDFVIKPLFESRRHLFHIICGADSTAPVTEKDQGATAVLVLPYFLHRGVHMLIDVPRMMREKAKKFPDVKVVLGTNLGFDEAIVDIVLKRIHESENLSDVREIGEGITDA